MFWHQDQELHIIDHHHEIAFRNAIRQAEEAAQRDFSAQLEEGLAALKEIGND